MVKVGCKMNHHKGCCLVPTAQNIVYIQVLAKRCNKPDSIEIIASATRENVKESGLPADTFNGSTQEFQSRRMQSGKLCTNQFLLDPCHER